ncbi:MAG: DUF881 domain-containing protein [Bacillota bacterium]|jgi:uncharacterized protein YlxW (UPF0749 family)
MRNFFKKAQKKWQIPLAIVLLAFGFLITAQYRTHIGVNNSLEGQSLDDLSALVMSLSENRTSLQEQLDSLQEQINSMKEKSQAGLSLTTTLTNQIRELKIINGTAPVEGPGVSITITGDSPIMYLDLIDIVNELFVTGAEVVSINDIRITKQTSFKESYSDTGNFSILINNQKLLYPIIIKAIGDPETLEKGLTFTGGIINNLKIFYNIHPTVKKEEVLQIPADISVNKTQSGYSPNS